MDELLYILNYNNQYPDVQPIVEALIESGVSSEQEDLIYSLAIQAFQIGEEQGRQQ